MQPKKTYEIIIIIENEKIVDIKDIPTNIKIKVMDRNNLLNSTTWTKKELNNTT